MVVIIYDLVGASMCECGSTAPGELDGEEHTVRTRINRKTIGDYENVVPLGESRTRYVDFENSYRQKM